MFKHLLLPTDGSPLSARAIDQGLALAKQLGAKVIAVLPGSAAERTGVQVGDRIVETEAQRVENALDYYMQETGFVGGQKVNIKVKRDGGAGFKKDVQLDQTWPGYLGLKLNAGVGDGPVVEGFLPFSPAGKARLRSPGIRRPCRPCRRPPHPGPGWPPGPARPAPYRHGRGCPG